MDDLISFSLKYIKTLTSIFCLFLGAFIINLRFDLFNSSILLGLLSNFLIFLYSLALFLIVGICIIFHFFQYREYYISRRFYLRFLSATSYLLQGSFVIIEFQKFASKVNPMNISIKMKGIHEVFFHEKVFSNLPKNHVYMSSIDQRGYDALSFSISDFDLIKKGDINKINLYEFKRISFKPQKFFNDQFRIYSHPFENQDHPKVLHGFRPKAVDLLDIGFFKKSDFVKTQEFITLPNKVTLTDFSSDFKQLVMAEKGKILHKDTILTEECLERFGVFLESYTSNTNMEIAKELNELISPNGSLYGLL